MSGETSEHFRRLEAELAELRNAIGELAVTQAEALNAISRHIRTGRSDSVLAELAGLPTARVEASEKALDAAKRSLQVAARLLL